MKKISLSKYLHFFVFFAVFFLMAIFLFLGNIERAEAKDCKCTNVTPDLSGSPFSDPILSIHVDRNLPNTTDCKDYCPRTYPGNAGGMISAAGEDAKPDDKSEAKTATKTAEESAAANGDCSFLYHPINCTLLTVLRAEGTMLQGATTLFGYIVDANSMKSIMDNSVIYEVWAMVRDILNILFILVLLFTAFATIFRIEKYNYKKILLTLVLMALLVNFSYPLIRIIIDFSNVLMYTLLRSNILGQQAANIPTDLANKMGLEHIIHPPMALQNSADSSFLLIAVIFVFIFMISILTIAVLLLIRAIALAILIMFSPVAFTGAIMPFGNAKTGQYWSMLFKYAFFGPIMIFMLSVSIKFMNSAINHAGSIDTLLNISGANSINTTYVATIAFFMIPLVLIWLGIMVAQSMSITGAGWVTKQAGRFTRWGLGLTAANTAWQAYQNRRKQGAERSWANRFGTEIGSRQDQAWGKVGEKLGIGGHEARQRYLHDQSIKVKQASDRHNMENLSVAQLNTLAQSGDKFEQAAAISGLIGKNAFDTNQDVYKKMYDKVRTDFGTESHVFDNINNGVKKSNPLVAYSHIQNEEERKQAYRDYVNSNSFDPKNISLPSDESKTHEFANFLEVAFTEDTMNRRQLEEIRGRSKDNRRRNVLKAAISEVAEKPQFASYNQSDPNKRLYREIQLANLNINGRISNAAKADKTEGRSNMTRVIYNNANEEDLKRLESDRLDRKDIKIMGDEFSSSKLSKIIPRMENDELAKEIAGELSKDSRHAKYIQGHPDLAGYYKGPGEKKEEKTESKEASRIIEGSKYGPVR